MEKTGIAVLDELTFETAAPPEAKPQPKTGRTPPKDGTCKRCGENKRVNRLMLCYKCWVITGLEDAEKAAGRAWTPGMPHPSYCQCEMPGGCKPLSN